MHFWKRPPLLRQQCFPCIVAFVKLYSLVLSHSAVLRGFDQSTVSGATVGELLAQLGNVTSWQIQCFRAKQDCKWNVCFWNKQVKSLLEFSEKSSNENSIIQPAMEEPQYNHGPHQSPKAGNFNTSRWPNSHSSCLISRLMTCGAKLQNIPKCTQSCENSGNRIFS